jgi:hypothetical protein
MRVRKVRGQLGERTRETYNFARDPLTTTPDCRVLSATPGSDTLQRHLLMPHRVCRIRAAHGLRRSVRSKNLDKKGTGQGRATSGTSFLGSLKI